MVKVRDASEAIEALGGTVVVAEALGISPTVVSNWKLPGRGFPLRRKDALMELLTGKGAEYDASALFRQQPVTGLLRRKRLPFGRSRNGETPISPPEEAPNHGETPISPPRRPAFRRPGD
jgi:hypothetical protein